MASVSNIARKCEPVLANIIKVVAFLVVLLPMLKAVHSFIKNIDNDGNDSSEVPQSTE